MPMDYHVRDSMLEHYQRYTPQSWPTSCQTILSSRQNDLPHEFIDKTIVSFCNRFQSNIAASGGH